MSTDASADPGPTPSADRRRLHQVEPGEPARKPTPLPVEFVTDDDRERAATLLGSAASQGLFDLDELETRLDIVYAATSLPDLHPAIADLPDVRQAPRATVLPSPVADSSDEHPALRNGAFRIHLTVYALTIGMLVGIWLLTGLGHPWPFYPAAGWGVGLGAHFALAARIAPKDRERPAPPMSEIPPTPAVPQLPGVPPTSIRRTFVVAMFVDVVDSTQLNEAMGDDDWMRVRDRCRSLIDECVAAEGGFEANVAGDGVLCRFESPGGAARAAIQIQRRLDRQRHEVGFAPQVRIGIHSGDAIDDGGDVIGTVVNLAARVTSSAAPAEILATEHVADHLDETVSIVDRGLHTLKGVATPRHLVAVAWD